MSGILIAMRDEIQVEELYTVGVLTLVVLMVGLAVSAISSKKITAPITNLTDAAHRVARGDYSHVEELRVISQRTDELGTMGKVFLNMVQAVEKREQDLQHQVKTLKVKIDRNKQHADLEKITGSDYFRMLKEKAGDLRLRTNAHKH